jgi:two-component system chemotaxis response regulator CheY
MPLGSEGTKNDAMSWPGKSVSGGQRILVNEVYSMGKKVLIVDDAAFMRMMLKDILQKNDFEIIGEAENGKVGVAAYQKFKPDIVTMDITMPEMNGIDAVKAIKALDPAAKIVMVSAMGQQPMVIEAIQAGANDFIVKPFQPERVVEALTKVLG